MATRNAVSQAPEELRLKCDWAGLLNTDVGDAQALSHYPMKAVQAIGTFGVGGSVAIEGSMDGTNWGALRDSTGTAIALTAATIVRDVLENPRFIRPRVTAGDGATTLTLMLWGAA